MFKSNKKTKTAKAVLEIDVFAKAKTKTSLRSFAFANYRSWFNKSNVKIKTNKIENLGFKYIFKSLK